MVEPSWSLKVTHRGRAVSADKPNALWTADYKGWWRTGDLKRCEPLTVRDQHSRFVLAVHVCRSPQIEEALQLFERLFELHGLPERILTDNGTPFVAPSSRFGLTRLSAWWLSLGIDHLRSRKGTPADNGGHERMHRDIAFSRLSRGHLRRPATGMRPVEGRLQQLPTP